MALDTRVIVFFDEDFKSRNATCSVLLSDMATANKDSTAQDTIGSFFYFKWNDLYRTEKPYVMFVDCPEGFPSTNYESERGASEPIKNLRGLEDQFNLDNHGFALRKHALQIDTVAADVVENSYLLSFEQLLKDELGADCRIMWFDWRVFGTSLRCGAKIVN